MKMEWLVVNSTVITFLIIAESEEFRVISAVFWPMRATFSIRELLCDLETPSLTLKPLLFVWGQPITYVCVKN